MKKKLLISILLIVAVILFSFPMTAFAANHVHNVNTGETFDSIQAAIDDGDTQAGHIIRVDAGTWTETNVDITKAVTIESTSEDPTDTIIQASSTTDHAFDVKVDNVTIRNLSIYGATGYQKAGIYLGSDITACAILNNRCGWDGSHKNSYGIYLFSSSGNTISGNTCNSNDDYGIVLSGSSDNTISGNTCSNNWQGIYLLSPPGGNTASGNTVTGNTGNHNHNCAIYLDCSSDNTISGNTCSMNMFGIGLSESSRNIVSSNTCNENTYGICPITSSVNNTVTGNTCNENTYGMWLTALADNNTLAANSCNQNSEYGIWMTNVSGNALAANNCNQNNYGVYLSGTFDNTIYLNNFGDNSTANVYSTASSNTWSSPTPLCYFYTPSHKSYMGNYYSDIDHTDSDGDGIADDDYNLPGSEPNDEYPLANTSDNYDIQAWWLNADSSMYEADMGKGPGTVEIVASGSHVWISDQSAQSDITFPAGGWTGQVVFESAPAADSILVEVGSSTDGSDFTPGGPQAIIGDGTTLTFATNAASFTVPPTHYMALRITNNDGSSHNVTTGGAWSYVSSCDTAAPNWPVPESATLVLLGLGLLVVGGFMWFGKRSRGRLACLPS